MCRIVLAKNPKLDYPQMELLMTFLIANSGGEGAGFVYTEEGEIHAAKSAYWDKRHGPYMAGVLNKLLSEVDTPVLFHTRLASVKGKNTYYAHPMVLDQHLRHEKLWKSINDEYWLAENIIGAMVHNGTLDRTLIDHLRLIYALHMGADVPVPIINGMSDTQLMAAFMYERGDFETPALFGSYGVVMSVEKKEGRIEHYINRSHARSLYLVYWDENRWAFMSNMPPVLYDEFKESGAEILTVPSINDRLYNVLAERGNFTETSKNLIGPKKGS